MNVKICCIADMAEANLALENGADALGLVGPMPSGPGVITDEEIAAIVQQLPSDIDTFLLTSETTAAEIIQHHQFCKTTTIQLVDWVTPSEFTKIRAGLRGVRLIQVIHVENDHSVQQALQAAQYADALLLDSGNPNAKVKTLGGTGQTHDWELSKRIVKEVQVPVWLAGGLRPENVGEAIAAVDPYGVDLCSGVRTEGKLDPEKLRAFMQAAK